MKALLHRMLATTLVGLAALAAGGSPSEAQLSDSRWPMLGHDARHTGQTDLLGPKFDSGTPGANDVRSLTFYDKIKMFPVVGADGSVYVGMGWRFCALKPLKVTDPDNPVFKTKWVNPQSPGCVPLNADVSGSSAAVDQDDYVYLGDRDNSVYKFRGSDGQRMWTHSEGHEGDHNASPTIAADGTVYFVFSQNNVGNGSILAVKNTGDAIFPVLPASFIKWKLAVGQYGTTSSPAIITDPQDGKKILILGFADTKVRAIKDHGTSATVLWKTTLGPGVGSISASPVIGPDGTVYIGGYGGLYALDPFDPTTPGRVKWTFPTAPANVDSTAAMSSNGTLYFVARNGNQRTVYAINPAAVTPQNPQAGLLWKYGPVTASLSQAGGFPIIGADGIIYVGMANGVYALQPNSGALLWKYLTTNGIMSAPVLGPPVGDTAATSTASGTTVLYFGSQDRNVYAIKSKRTGLAQNDPPVPHLQITPGQSVPAGTEVTFNASTSTDPNQDQLFYSWDLGDGTFASGAIVHHTYWGPCQAPNPCVGNTYPITLTVSDGLESTTYLPKPNVAITGGGPAFFCDAFTRGQSTTLGGPGSTPVPAPCTAPSTLTWQEYPPGSLSINNANQMVNDPIKATHIATVGGLAGADQAVAVDFISTINSTAPRFGALLRVMDSQNYYMAYRWVGGASVLRLSKVVAGVETVLAQMPVPNPAVGVPFRLKASVAGSTLTLQLVGGASISVPNATTFIGGGVGLLFSWATPATPSYIADDFRACVGPTGVNCSGIQ